MLSAHELKNLETFKKWFSDEDTIVGIFENHAMDSANCGEKIALSFSKSQEHLMKIGSSRAPDTSTIIGWKYILQHIAYSPEEALELLTK